MKAHLNDVVLAESDKTIVVEGNNYFPPDSVRWDFLQKSETTYTCPWKGECDYYNVVINGTVLEDAGWSYHTPKEAAKEITRHVAFSHQITVGD